MAIIRGNDLNNALGGTDVADTILGFDGDDVLTGQAANDALFGGFGDDSLLGGDGNDRLFGDAGDDDIFGGNGSDQLFAGRSVGSDFLFGGNGADTLMASEGFDFLDGGQGNDTLIGVSPDTGWTTAIGFSFGLRGVTVNLAAGFAIDEYGTRDTLRNIRDIDATDRSDNLVGDANDNFFTAYEGNDRITGGAGRDEVNYDTSGGIQGIFANLFTGVVTDNYGFTDRLSSIEMIRATGFTDRIIGGTADETFRAYAGDDIVNGGAGFDEIWYDLDLESGGFRGVEVNLAGGFAVDASGDLDSIVNIEGARGTALTDRLTGDGFANRLDGGFGIDRIVGGGGNDTLIGGQGNDVMHGGSGIDTASYAEEAAAGASLGVDVRLNTQLAFDGFLNRDRLISIENAIGTEFDDRLLGSSEANTLSGGDGLDNIRGGGGNDLIEGGGGTDRLFGEQGTDSFRFTDGFELDRIEDFSTDEILDFSNHSRVLALSDLRVLQSGDVLRIDAGGDTLLILNTDAADLSAANYIF
ncbi:MAG: calcium-binding protein [Pseudomonadota bacterium]